MAHLLRGLEYGVGDFWRSFCAAAFSRRVWKLLQQVKCSSAVLLTTHAMEEADVLGDEIGIMAKGSLKAFGTSLQLKHDHGSGYSLNIVKRTGDVSTDAIVTCVCEIEPLDSREQNCALQVSMTEPRPPRRHLWQDIGNP